jgi:hypothetical protein
MAPNLLKDALLSTPDFVSFPPNPLAAVGVLEVKAPVPCAALTAFATGVEFGTGHFPILISAIAVPLA